MPGEHIQNRTYALQRFLFARRRPYAQSVAEITPGSLLRQRDFMRVWGAETVSQLGSQISLIAFPLIAITLLDATTLQVGLLTAIEFSPFVLIGLPAGAIVDRLPRRPVLMWCDIG